MNTLLFITDRISNENPASESEYSSFKSELIRSWKHNLTLCKNAVYILITLEQSYLDCDYFCEEDDFISVYIFTQQKPTRYLSSYEKRLMSRNFNFNLDLFDPLTAIQNLLEDLALYMDRSAHEEAIGHSRPVSMLMLLSFVISSSILAAMATIMKNTLENKKLNSDGDKRALKM
ncbi:uncharacterized protein LOC134856316 [Symsagittifera roscoffensis]|uniref:uncharacterized protein LOC134856316 n=1 Tax=Symsagittifera roscoffensis TaxID=84072 RepID=UPI00307B1262